MLPQPLRAASPGAEGVRKLRAAGHTAEALVAAGFTPKELFEGGLPKLVKNCVLLKDNGFGVAELRSENIGLPMLRDTGFSVWEMRVGGLGVRDISALYDASCFGIASGFTIYDLKKAGWSYIYAEQAGYSVYDACQYMWRGFGDHRNSDCWSKWDGNDPLNCRGVHGEEFALNFQRK